MDASQRRPVAWAAYAIAAVLLAIFFVRPFWAWATWNPRQGTLDLGFVRVTNRPPFPADAAGVGLGLVVPIAKAAFGRVIGTPRRD